MKVAETVKVLAEAEPNRDVLVREEGTSNTIYPIAIFIDEDGDVQFILPKEKK